MPLTRSDVDGLRLAVDKAKMIPGMFDAAQRLEELLDAHDRERSNGAAYDELQGDFENRTAALEAIQQRVKGLELLKRPDPNGMDASALQKEVQELRDALDGIENDAGEWL